MSDARGSAREWRLWAVAMIAGVYALVWSRIGPSTPTAAPTPAMAPAPASRTAWLPDLPPDRRPAVAPPPGWRVADRTAAVAPPVVRRAPASQPVRIRTRSS